MIIGLKGSIINNLFMLRTRGFGIYLLMTLAFFIGYLITDEPTLLLFTKTFLVVGLPIGLLEAFQSSFICRWSAFEKAFGISPDFMVLSRYIMFICTAALCSAVWVVSGMYLPEYYTMVSLSFLFFWANVTCIAYFPIMHLLNPNKSSVGVTIMFATFGAAFLLMNFVVMPLTDGSFLPTLMIIAALYVVSATISLILDKINRGRAV